ncbi:hypothetical protein B0H19DRAFT_1072168 [Mycena capillaripes]|nr:hypothetical protein B0H19DRAFT_1072168 [Mycena capillaripes]
MARTLTFFIITLAAICVSAAPFDVRHYPRAFGIAPVVTITPVERGLSEAKSLEGIWFPVVKFDSPVKYGWRNNRDNYWTLPPSYQLRGIEWHQAGPTKSRILHQARANHSAGTQIIDGVAQGGIVEPIDHSHDQSALRVQVRAVHHVQEPGSESQLEWRWSGSSCTALREESERFCGQGMNYTILLVSRRQTLYTFLLVPRCIEAAAVYGALSCHENT